MLLNDVSRSISRHTSLSLSPSLHLWNGKNNRRKLFVRPQLSIAKYAAIILWWIRHKLYVLYIFIYVHVSPMSTITCYFKQINAYVRHCSSRLLRTWLYEMSEIKSVLWTRAQIIGWRRFPAIKVNFLRFEQMKSFHWAIGGK